MCNCDEIQEYLFVKFEEFATHAVRCYEIFYNKMK